MTKTFKVNATIWIYPGPAAWYFVTLPKDTKEEIDFYFGHSKKGWGSLPVTVTIGKTSWRTSIFPDKKAGSYILPLKAQVRKKESLKEGDNVKLSLELKD